MTSTMVKKLQDDINALRADLKTVRVELDAWRTHVDILSRAFVDARAQAEEARWLLVRIEWSAGSMTVRCPVCLAPRVAGHNPQCRLAAFLKLPPPRQVEPRCQKCKHPLLPDARYCVQENCRCDCEA